jgi:hypothetical protein
VKQRSVFEESRPEMFRLLLAEATEDVRSQFTHRGRYIHGATRKQVRSLARLKARDAMRSYRRVQQEKPRENT